MYKRYGKRILDLVLASVGVIIIFVPMLFVALVIKLDSRGPVLFKQPRYGKDKKPFTVYKFRTMSTDAPADMPTNEFVHAGSYITRFGKIMRKLSIDELPQLVNVLRGEMSIVGPRPVVLTEKELIRQRAKYHANSVKPGITGWAQVNGRDELDYLQKAELDGWYVKNLSFKTDVKCIVKTFYVALSLAGHTEGHEQVDNNQQLESTGGE